MLVWFKITADFLLKWWDIQGKFDQFYSRQVPYQDKSAIYFFII